MERLQRTLDESSARLRQALPPRLGRPNDPQKDAAVRMVKEEGKTVKEVLRLQIADFDKMDKYGSYLAEKGLRVGLARRRRSRRM